RSLCCPGRLRRDGAETTRADPLDEGGEPFPRLAFARVATRHGSDGRRGALLGKATDALANPPLPFADAPTDQDRVERPLAAVAGLHQMAGEPDVPDVVLAARVGAATDLDPERAESLGEAVARLGVGLEVGVDALPHPHGAGDGERAVVHSRARDHVGD